MKMMIDEQEVEVEQFEGTEEEWYVLCGYTDEKPKTYVWIVEHLLQPIVFVKESSDPANETENVKRFVAEIYGKSTEIEVLGPHKALTNW